MATIVSTYINDEGHEIAVYASGAERDVAAGRMVKAPASTLITSENATALTRKRWEKFRLASNSRIVREAAAIDPTVKTPADAYGLLTSRQYVALLDYDKPRVDELEKMGEIMAGGSMDRRQPETVNNTMNVIALPEDVARAIADLRRLMVENRKDVE